MAASTSPPPGCEFRAHVEHPRPGTAVLALYGDADLQVVDELRDRLASLIDGGAQAVVVDLTGVTFLDSTTLSALVVGAKRARARGAELRLVVPRSDLRRIFELTLLDRVLHLAETRHEALTMKAATSV